MLSIVMKPSQTCARMIGQTLIATFRAASPPLIWQYDLEKNHSFSVTVQGEDGKWSLGVVAPQGEFVSVAKFNMRAEADEAFAAVERAMKRPRRLFRPWQGWVRSALLIVLFLLLGLFAVKLIFGETSSNIVKPASNTATEPSLNVTKPTKSGQTNVPLVADDFLKMPEP